MKSLIDLLLFLCKCIVIQVNLFTNRILTHNGIHLITFFIFYTSVFIKLMRQSLRNQKYKYFY